MNHLAVVGLGWGDESKGSTIDYLAYKAQEWLDPYAFTVRFNGGHQAAHNVVLSDGREHTFSQYGSGTFRGLPTILSRFMVVEPIGFMRERQHLLDLGIGEYPGMVIVDSSCLIATPWHMALNREAERSRDEPHGTCGLGFGETVAYDLDYPGWGPRVRDLFDIPRLQQKLWAIHGHCVASRVPVQHIDVEAVIRQYVNWAFAVSILSSETIYQIIGEGPCIFEGAQGVLLDEWHGFHPHTTWSTTTYENIDQLVDNPDDVERLGVVRTYTTRHGAGPLPTESDVLTELLREKHNEDSGAQGSFRCGDFDAVAHRYAVDVCGRVDSLVVSHMDVADRLNLKICTGYSVDDHQWWSPTISDHHDLTAQAQMTEKMNRAVPYLTPLDRRYDSIRHGTVVHEIEKWLGVPVSLTSWGPTAEDKCET